MADFFDLPRYRRWRVYAVLFSLTVIGLIIGLAPAPWRSMVLFGVMTLLTGVAAVRFMVSANLHLRVGHAGTGFLHLLLSIGLALTCLAAMVNLLG